MYGNPPMSSDYSLWEENYMELTAGEVGFNTLILKNNENKLYNNPINIDDISLPGMGI